MTVLGAILCSLAAFFWGRERGRLEEEKILILEGLISFIAYTEEQITNFKTPLYRIYSDFCEPTLEKIGFISLLQNSGIEKAVEILKGRLSESSLAGWLLRRHHQPVQFLCQRRSERCAAGSCQTAP